MSTTARLIVHVKPRSRETRILREPDGTFTMFVTAPAEKGKANREIVKWLAKRLGKPSSQVRLLAGLHSSLKVIEVIGMGEEEVSVRLLATGL